MISLFSVQESPVVKLDAYSGVASEGRHFLITQKDSVLYGVNGNVDDTSYRALVSYQDILSKPWNFRLVSDNTYEIYSLNSDGDESYLYFANGTDESGVKGLTVSTSPDYPYRWTITSPSSGNYRLSIIETEQVTRYLCYLKTDSNMYLRGVTSSNNSSYYYGFGLHSFDTASNEFLDAFNEITCDNGKTLPSTSKWSDAKDVYDSLNNPSKRYFQFFSAVKDSSDPIEACLAKYEYIIAKYGETLFPNYMNRTIHPLSYYGNNFVNTVTSGSTLIIVVVTGLSVASLCLLFVARKKKQK